MKFALASAGAAAVVWIICSLLVWLMPGAMMNMTTNLFHMEMGKSGFVISPAGETVKFLGLPHF